MKTIELPKGASMYRAAPYIHFNPGNGKSSATKSYRAWFGPAREDVTPYDLRIQPHLGNKISIIREYNVTKPLKFINLGDVNTVQNLSKKINISNSFVIENGKVKRVSGTNQFQSNKKTANRLRSFLLVQYPNVHGWFQPEMQKPSGGIQKAEFMVFSPNRSGVKGKGAQGSGIPSPIRPQNSRRASPRASPRAPRASPRQASPRAGASPRQASRSYGAPPLATPASGSVKRRKLNLSFA